MGRSAASQLPPHIQALLRKLVQDGHYPDEDAALEAIIQRESELNEARKEGWHLVLTDGDRVLELA